MDDLTYVKFLSIGHPLMTLIFSGSTSIPSVEIIFPK
jgi:hypothetical protein